MTHPEGMEHFFSLAANAAYFIATNTTLLGKTFGQDDKQLHEEDDVVFAASLILKHILIHNSNAFSVNFLSNISSLNISVCEFV